MSTTVTEEHHKAKLLENYSVDEQFLSRLKDPLLVKTGGYINGTWTSEKHSKLVDVLNPGTGKLLGKVATQSQAEMHQAVEIAHKVFQKWKQETSTVKSKLLFEIARLHETHLDDLATIITFESGKTLLEAKGEVLYGASYFRWFSEEAKRVYGDTIPDPVRSRRIMVTKEPVGVCALISPWNFPNAMMARKIAPALAAGCSVVAKPASETPYSVLALGELFHRACVSLKLPQEYLGLVQILLTARHEAQSFSDVVMSRSEVRKLSFTGSTKVGKLLMRDASTTLKKLSLELGGNAPFIVFDTLKTGAQRTKYITDIVDAILASKFRNAGQTCVCLNRLFVQKSIKKEVLDLLQEKVSQLTVGNGLERDVNLGPLISADAVKKCRSLIHDALEQGAYVAAKGKLHSTASEDGYFLEPYVLDHCTDNMTLVEQEIFGPIGKPFLCDSCFHSTLFSASAGVH